MLKTCFPLRTWALLAAVVSLTAACAPRGSDPNVLLITVDTLRADHLGLYGYPRAVTPALDSFGAQATVFAHAMSQAPHTVPSLLEIMTSKYRQGVEIAADDPTLAELLTRHGYETAAVVDNALLELPPTARGLMRGFEKFYRNGVLDLDAVQQHWKTKTPADCITAQAIRWLKRRDAKRPFFLWLHYFDPHDPYLPPYADDLEELSRHSDSSFTGDIRNTFLFSNPQSEEARTLPEKDRQHLIALYDAEIRYFDQSFGELLEFLKDQRLYRDSMIVLSADHGESFGDHGIWMHGFSLYESETHIPMIIKFPGQTTGERVLTPVQAIDIFPTIAETAHLAIDRTPVDGVSLHPRSPQPVFAFWGPWQAARSGDWKLVTHDQTTELFNVSTDPGELHDLSADQPQVLDRLTRALQAKSADLQHPASPAPATSGPDVIEQMRALGYLAK